MFLREWWFELALLVIILGCGFALAALADWHVDDPTVFRAGPGRVENSCGPVGATVAAALYGLVGYGAWAIAVPAVVSGLTLAGRSVFHFGRWFGSFSLYLVALAGVELGMSTPELIASGRSPGGLAGQALGGGLAATFGTAGAWLVLGSLGVLLVTALFEIRWGVVAARVVDFLEAHWPTVKEYGLHYGANGARGTWWLTRWAASAVAASAVVFGRWTAIGARGGARLALGGAVVAGRGAAAAGRGAVGSVGKFGDGFRRMGQSLTRTDLTDPEIPSRVTDSNIDEDVGSDLPDPSSSAGVIDAEVQWEPTRVGERGSVTRTDEAVARALFVGVEPRRTRSDAGSRAGEVVQPSDPVFFGAPRPSRVMPVAAGPNPAVRSQPVPAVRSQPVPAVGASANREVAAPPAPSRVVPPARVAQVMAELDDASDPDDAVDEDDLEEGLDDELDDDLDEDLDEDDLDELDASSDADEAPARPLDAGSRAANVPVKNASAVIVHENKLLGARVHDDGGAIVKARQEFNLPTLSMLDEVPEQKAQYDEAEMRRMALLVEEKLLSFKIGGQVVAVRPGPVVTIFEFLPNPGVKVSRIAALSDDLAMAMKAVSVRIVAPVPGKGVVGIEIPSPKRLTIYLRELLASSEFRNGRQQLPIALGQDVEGRPVVGDLAAMPHVLVGGTTGSGKSVGVNGMLMSLLFTRTPDDLRMLLIDPKKLEFEMYDGIPHLLYPVVTEPKEAAAALAWACREMDDRYEVLARWGVRNIVGYNAKVEKELHDWTGEKARKYAPKGWTELDGPLSAPHKLPYIVIVIDELADLMMVAGKDVEESICRIAQKARACGIHLICATQRPSVDVVTGLIKANLPTRIAYQLRTRTDSRTILDSMGAEALLGRGDLLYLPPGVGNLARCHGAFCSDDEVSRVTDHVRAQGKPEYIAEIVATPEAEDEDVERDELFDQAVQVCIQQGKASTSLVQRHLKIGYNRAANLVEQMERAGIVGPADGARPREVLVSSVD